MNGEVFLSGPELLDKLTRNELSSPLILIGMIKPDEHDKNIILFSHSGCLNWVRVPVNSVERANVLGELPCKDHSHSLVSLQIKEPDSELARVLHNLLRTYARTDSQPAPAVQAPTKMLANRLPEGAIVQPSSVHFAAVPASPDSMTCGRAQQFSGACVSNCICQMPTMNGWQWVCCNHECC